MWLHSVQAVEAIARGVGRTDAPQPLQAQTYPGVGPRHRDPLALSGFRAVAAKTAIENGSTRTMPRAS
jgi:hypothetical protein